MVARAKCATLFEVTPLLGFDVNIIREIYVDVQSNCRVFLVVASLSFAHHHDMFHNKITLVKSF